MRAAGLSRTKEICEGKREREKGERGLIPWNNTEKDFGNSQQQEARHHCLKPAAIKLCSSLAVQPCGPNLSGRRRVHAALHGASGQCVTAWLMVQRGQRVVTRSQFYPCRRWPCRSARLAVSPVARKQQKMRVGVWPSQGVSNIGRSEDISNNTSQAGFTAYSASCCSALER